MKNIKTLCCGLTAGIVIGSLTVVGANQAIQALQNDQIKIQLNGQVQVFKDEITGEVQYPITYHDRTYLPMRNVAQLSGLDVDWDAENNIAKLENKFDGIFYEDYGTREVFYFKDYLCTLYTAPWGQTESDLNLINSNGNVKSFNVYYDETEKKFLCEVDGDRLLVTEYKYDGQDSSHGGMAKYHRRDYEIVYKDGELIDNTIVEKLDDIKYDART
jgi:hypothetical protein